MRVPISIIIINHNNDHLIDVVKNCITQLISDDEIIIVNDDTNNISIVNSLKRKYSQIISINAYEKKNNRNIGLRRAKNEIVLMIDGDILIDNNALDMVASEFFREDVVAVTGFTHLMSYTFEQLLLLGFFQKYDYLQFSKMDILTDYPDLLDYRISYGDEKLNSDYNWVYFFTSFFAIHKGRIPKSVLFLDNLDGWGAEDIEFAYQVSLSGCMRFNRNINNIHIPHSRDHVKNLETNHKNLYFLLKEHPTLDFEVLLTFSSPGTTIARIKNMINVINHQNSTTSFTTFRNSCLYTTLYSYDRQNIFVYGDNNKKYSLLGTALPLSTQSVETAYIDGAIMKYPTCIVSLILREHLRIAKTVYIIGEIGEKTFIDDGYFKSHIIGYIDCPAVYDLRMFQFLCCDEGFQVNSSIPKYEICFDN